MCGIRRGRLSAGIPRCAQQYQAHLSGPFLDRIDLYYDRPPVAAVDLALPSLSEGSEEVRMRVAQAREIQTEQPGHVASDTIRSVYADTPHSDLDKSAAPDEAGAALLADAARGCN